MMYVQRIFALFWLCGCVTNATEMLEKDTTVYVTVCPPLLRTNRSQLQRRSPLDFDTVHEAQDSARQIIAGGHKGAVVVELCGGAHPSPKSLILGAADVAPKGTTWQGAAEGKAYFDSGVVIKDWVAGPGGVWTAKLPMGTRSRQLWVDGERAERAHSNPYVCSGGPDVPGDIPSGGPSGQCAATICEHYGGPKNGCGMVGAPSTAIRTATGYTNIPETIPVMSKKPLATWLVGTELVFGKGASGASWTEPRCTVTQVTPDVAGTVNITMAQPCWSLAVNKGGGQGVRFPSDVENSAELLTKPGNWFADFNLNIISYIPLPGQNMATVDAILGSVPSGGVGSMVEVERGTTGLTFDNLGFIHQTWLQPSTPLGFVDLQSGFFYNQPGHLVGVPGALRLHGVKNVSVHNCTFKHLGLAGVVADDGSQNVVIDRSTFADTSGSAVSLGNVSSPILTPATQDGPFTVENNMIRDTGNEYHGCAGVFGGYVAETSISFNDIANTSNGAITIGWGWGATNTMRANTVNSNRILRSNTELYDCGSIYTLSDQPGSEVAHNYIENQVLLFGSLYHDAKSAGFHTHSNVIVGGPMWLYLQWGSLGPVHDILIENNYHNQTIAGGCATPKEAPTCPQNLTVRDNVLVNGSAWPAPALAIKAAAGIQPIEF
eukprot:m.132960 g.132960  ORF g.132960 m.132960 type:complete len:661 (-) comp29643_c0_seq1:46-2028(-)